MTRMTALERTRVGRGLADGEQWRVLVHLRPAGVSKSLQVQATFTLWSPVAQACALSVFNQ